MKIPNQQTGFIQQHAEYGGTILGFILGLGVGLVVALVIAFYLSKNTPQDPKRSPVSERQTCH